MFSISHTPDVAPPSITHPPHRPLMRAMRSQLFASQPSVACTHFVAAAMRFGLPCALLSILILAITSYCCIAQQSNSSPPFAPPFSAPPPPLLAPLLSAPRPIAAFDSGNSTSYRYIVVLAPSLSPANLSDLIASILPSNATVHKLLIGPPPPLSIGLSATTPAFNAFSAYLTAAQLATVRASPLVAYVEQDGLISLDLGIDLIDMAVIDDIEEAREVSVGQVGGSNPLYSWGLDRIVSSSERNVHTLSHLFKQRQPLLLCAHCCTRLLIPSISEQAPPATLRQLRSAGRSARQRSDRIHHRHRMPHIASRTQRSKAISAPHNYCTTVTPETLTHYSLPVPCVV